MALVRVHYLRQFVYTDRHIHTTTYKTTNLIISSNVHFVPLAEITSLRSDHSKEPDICEQVVQKKIQLRSHEDIAGSIIQLGYSTHPVRTSSKSTQIDSDWQQSRNVSTAVGL